MTSPLNEATARRRKQLSKLWQLRAQRAANATTQQQREIDIAMNELEQTHVRNDALDAHARQHRLLLENELRLGLQAGALRTRREHLVALLASRAAVQASLIDAQKALAKQQHALATHRRQHRYVLLKQRHVQTDDRQVSADRSRPSD